MDHDHWGALVLFIITAIMLLPSTIDNIRKTSRKNKIRRNSK